MSNLMVLFINIMFMLIKILLKIIRFTGLYVVIFTFIIGYKILKHIGATFGSIYEYIFIAFLLLSFIAAIFITIHNFKKLLTT